MPFFYINIIIILKNQVVVVATLVATPLAHRQTAKAEHRTLARNEASKNCRQFIRVITVVMVLS